MPDISARFEGLGVGFAPYLQPPGPEIVRWTVGEPGFATPKEILDVAIGELEAGNTKYTRGSWINGALSGSCRLSIEAP